MSRDIRVAFKLSEEKKSELEHYANSYGVTMSALCALVIGQWLHQQENVQKPMIKAITETLTVQMKAMLDNMDGDTMKEMIKNAKELDRS